jgi:hypothetical protein
MGNKTLIIVLAVVLLLGVLFYWQFVSRENGNVAVEENKTDNVSGGQLSGGDVLPTSLPPATGDVDSFVDSLFSVSGGEEQILSQDNDASLVGSDAQAVSDFGVAYDENSL